MTTPAISVIAAKLGAPLSAGQAGLLLRFESLLSERALSLGLIAATDADRIHERHVLDSLRSVAVLSAERDAYDLGSGAGLPGIVVAIARPDLRMCLVESRSIRAAFLEYACEALELANVTVITGRIEKLFEPVDVCFARALTSLSRSWSMARPLLRHQGRLVYFAGRAPTVGEIPANAAASLVPSPPVLESSGPLVIMTRQ